MKIIKTARYRARYQGQLQGDEYRPGSSVTNERYQDNDIIEGPHVQKLRVYFKDGKWDEFNRYVDKLREEGHSQNRIQSMISTATLGKI